MSSDHLQITTQFTDDCIASQASVCERPACSQPIQAGQKRFYVGPDENSNRPGRYICEPCMSYYLKKPSTTARVVPTRAVPVSGIALAGPSDNQSQPRVPTANPGIPGTAVNLSVIRKMVNESQRRGGHTPQGRVTAVSQQVSRAPVSSLPFVNNPSAFQGYFQHASSSATAPLSSLPSSGYSSAHLQYEEERQRWSTSAYKPAPVSRAGYGQIPMRAQTRDQVRIVLQVCYLLLSGKSEKTSIREGMPVDYEILPFALSEFIKVTLLPPLSKLIPGFSWDFSAMVVRETSSWQDILKMDPSVPYFQGRFLKVKTGAKSDGSRVFSAPKNPIEFSLIVNRDQWLQAEEYQENQNSGYQVHSMRSATPESVPKRKTPPSPEKIRPSAPSLAKRPNVSSSRSSGILSIAASDKEGKKPAFKSLNPDQVRQGILLGGQNAIMERKKNFDLKITEQVACFTINIVPFEELCQGKNAAEIIDDKSKFLGFLFYDKGDIIGKGTFKTANFATLEWLSISPSAGLGAKSSEPIPVALKRPYDDSQPSKIKRFNYADESRKVLMEGTLLGWADSLLRFAYNFIDNFVADQDPLEPPFDIPRLRFVKGIIAYSEKSLDHTSSARSATSHRAAYLLEELIPTGQTFVKYIHNADAVPLQDADEPGYEIGVFLCFIQHVQFVHTHGQAYISDFQGAGDLLTDPQVMTHPSLDKQGTLFGEGNVNTAFESFTAQHKCSHYCKWFQLEEFPVEEERVEAE